MTSSNSSTRESTHLQSMQGRNNSCIGLTVIIANNFYIFQEQHERRWGALYASMMQSDNMLVQYMARRAMYNVLGTLGTNMVTLRHKFGVPR